MTCLHSAQALYNEETKDLFFPRFQNLYKDHPGYDLIEVPCGNCIFCKVRKARDWAVRSICQKKMSFSSYFITLTYNPQKWPHYKGLNFDHLKNFFKRFRIGYYRDTGQNSRLLYLACGEYGSKRGHPHYHALIYNHPLDDIEYLDKSKQRGISKTLERDWPWGFHSIGQVTSKSAKYLANYTLKKSMPRDEDSRKLIHKTTGQIFVRPPEAVRVSQGFGLSFYYEYFSDIYPSDSFRLEKDGKPCRPPAYFDQKLKEDNPEMYEEVKRKRKKKLLELLARQKDVTPQAREANFLARFKNLRSLEKNNLKDDTLSDYIVYDPNYYWKYVFPKRFL